MINGLIGTLMHIRRQIDIFNKIICGACSGWTSWIFQANTSVDARVPCFNLIGLLIVAVCERSIHSVVHYNLDIRLGQFDLLIVDLNYECIGLDVANWQL